MSVKKYEYIRGTRQEIRDYLEKELMLQPQEDRGVKPIEEVTLYYPTENTTFDKQLGDKSGFTSFFYLEADPTVEWFAEVADESGNMQKVPSIKFTLVKIDLFITD